MVEIARMLNGKGYETPSQYFRRKHPIRKISGIHQIRSDGITILSEIS